MGPPKIPKKRPRHWWLRGIIVCAYLLFTILLHNVKAEFEEIRFDPSNPDSSNSSLMGKYIVQHNIYLSIFMSSTIYILIFLIFFPFALSFFLRVPFFFYHSQYYIPCHFHIVFFFFCCLNSVASMVYNFSFFSTFIVYFATRENFPTKIIYRKTIYVLFWLCVKHNLYRILTEANKKKAQWITDMESMIVY